MPYILAALVLLAFGTLLYRAYRQSGDLAVLLKGTALVGAGFLFVAFTRSMIVYKPLMVLHIAMILLYGYGVTVYLLQGRVRPFFLAAPLASLALFFAVAWLFRET
ncbi:hypothetical protein [Hydrogenimonas sp. SS33]|uniref:hypothetical protein n=1 Tax=Hydrogenimonas leucolamina TaxID=2954236 RepID=UPI00336C169F